MSKRTFNRTNFECNDAPASALRGFGNTAMQTAYTDFLDALVALGELDWSDALWLKFTEGCDG